jgi:hypothetical protein
MNSKRLIFIDNEASCQADHGDGHYIALNPAVYACLREKGSAVDNTLPYFSSASHERLLRKSNELTNWLRDNLEFVDLGIGIKDSYRDIFIYRFRFVIHYCLWAIEVVSNAVDKNQPKMLVAAVAENKSISSLYLEPEEGCLSTIVKNICRAHSLDFEKNNSKPQNIIKSKINDLITLFKFTIKLVKKWFGRKSHRSKPIVFTTDSYKLDQLASQIIDHEVCFIDNYFVPKLKLPKSLFGWNQKMVKNQQEFIGQLCRKILSQNDLFVYRKVDFSQIIIDKIKRDYSNFIFKLILSSIFIDRELSDLNPLLVISNVSRLDDLITAELCQARNIPSMLISHGSHVKPKNEIEMIEWGEHGKQFLSAPFSMIVVPTPTSNEYFDAFPTEATIVKSKPMTWGIQGDKKVGEALFYKLFGGNYKKGKIRVIVHAGTPKPSNSLRFHVYETMDEYIQALRDLANVVEQLDNTVLVIKFRPCKELDIKTLKALVPFSDKIKLSVDESLLDVLAMADLLVSFSSTAIDEALQNRTPVLLYGGNGRYQHISADEIKENEEIKDQAIYHLKQSRILFETISKILKIHEEENKEQLFNKYIHSDGVNNSFLELINERISINEKT